MSRIQFQPQVACDFAEGILPAAPRFNEGMEEANGVLEIVRYQDLRRAVEAIVASDMPQHLKVERLVDYVMGWEK